MMIARYLGLSIRLLWRDWRGGELALLIVALVTAVATVTTIALFADRLDKSLLSESAAFLGADRAVAGSRRIGEEWRRKASDMGLAQAETLSFSTVVFASADEQARGQLVSVKAVTPSYPLKGKIHTAPAPFQPGQPTAKIPEPGELWLDSRLFPALSVALGDRLSVGRAELEITGVVTSEPDRAGGVFNLGPRLMMNFADISETEVVRPGSRIFYRLLLSGSDEKLEAYREAIAQPLAQGFRWRDVRDDNAGIAEALDRAESFLLLGGLLGVILAGVAIALVALRYAQRHYDNVAVLKTLGQTPQRVALLYLSNIGLLGMISTALGLLAGLGLHYVLIAAFREFIAVELPAAGWEPYLLSFVTGLICLLSFAAPPLLKLKDVSPLRVIRRDFDDKRIATGITYLAGGLGSLLLLIWYSGSPVLAGIVLLGVGVAVAVLLALSWLLLRGGRFLGMQAGSAWRLALAALSRRGRSNSVQMVAFGIALLPLVLLTLVRTGLLDEWQSQLPPQAANHFLINIAPHEVSDVQAMLAARAIRSENIYPMIRGRISTIGGQPVLAREAERVGGVTQGGPPIDSERNFSWSAQLPEDNVLTAGTWWTNPQPDRPLVSIESYVAEVLDAKVGETMSFQIADQTIEAEIANIRKVDWTNFRPNFYLLFSPGVLDDLPGSWMTSFRLEPQDKLFLNDFLRRFPTVTVIEIDAVIARVRDIVEKVSRAIELILVLVLVSGAIVLVSGVRVSMQERYREYAVLRTLGGNRRLVLSALAIEFCTLGVFAGILALIGAEIAFYGLKTQVFQLSFSPSFGAWLLVPLIGMVIIGLIGMLSSWRVIRIPPMAALRRA